jgi:aspartokinase
MKRLTLTFGQVSDGSVLLQIGEMIQQLEQAGHTLVVVVRALDGVTAQLRESMTLGNYVRVAKKLLSQHSSVARKMVRDADSRQLLIQDLTDILEAYSWLGRSMSNRQPTGAEAQQILGVGDRLSARLLTGFLQSRGVRARAFNANEVLEDEATFTRRLPRLLDQVAVLVTGDSPQTFHAASLLAVATEADGLWLMTEQDGLFTADPQVVPTAQQIPVINLEYLDDLAVCGLPLPLVTDLIAAFKAQIPVYIRSISAPENPGTFVQPRPAGQTQRLIAAQSQVRLLRSRDQNAAALLPTLAEHHIHALASGGALIVPPGAATATRQLFIHLEPDPRIYALATVVGLSESAATTLSATLDLPADIPVLRTETAHGSILLSVLITGNRLNAIVEKVHNLTLRQLK